MTEHVSLFTAYLAGFASFLSPCILPLLPAYTAFLTGEAKGNQGVFLFRFVCFWMGFTLVFVLMGATASFLGQLFQEYQEMIRKVGAVFIAAMGLHLAGIVSFSWLYREYRPFLAQTFQGYAGAFLLGVAFTAGWTPCSGPILAAILLYAGNASSVSQGAVFLLFYAIGFSTPFLVVVVFLQKYLYRINRLYRILPWIQKMAGILLLLMGVILYFDMTQRILGVLF